MIERGCALWVVLVLAACGGGGTTDETTDGTGTGDTGGETTATSGEVPSPARPWDELSMDEKRQWMGTEVLPRMAALFEGHDAERFGGFTCNNCHGEDAQARNFEMPNPSIMALYPTGTVEQQQMVETHRPMVVFMFQQVLPTMQKLLGAPAYDEATQEGFSCFACHPHGGEGTPAPQQTASL